MKHRLFISYSHKDREKVTSIVSKLALGGYDIWMDVKDINTSDNYILKIAEGVHSSDVYVIFLTNNSVSSDYVNLELSYAVKREAEEHQFKIIPILLEKISIPKVIAIYDYIDATSISLSVIDKINSILKLNVRNSISERTLTSMEFVLAENTEVEFDKNDFYENNEIVENCNRLLHQLRSKVYGILMNFVPIEEFDLKSETPQFTNGIYDEKITTESGKTISTNCKRVALETIVYMPNEKKVRQLLELDCDLWKFESITFGFSLPIKKGESYETIGKRCLAKLRDKYIILEYSVKYGAKIKLKDNFYLSFAISDEQLRITLNSKYDFQLLNELKEFDVYKFINNLLS